MTEERKNKLKEIRHKLANLTDAEKQAYQDRGILKTVEGRTLSWHNTIMCYIVAGLMGFVPTVVGGYRQWQAAGRQVSKGQHGMTILFPVGEKNEDGEMTGDVERWFCATVFDVSQTEEIKKSAEPVAA